MPPQGSAFILQLKSQAHNNDFDINKQLISKKVINSACRFSINAFYCAT
jgi:hypothetical protein